MAYSQLASVRRLGIASHRLLMSKHKVEMSTALTRLISSSGKKPAVAGRLTAPSDEIENPPRTVQDFIDAPSKPRNWITYGFNYSDREDDADAYHSVMFGMFSVIIVGTIFMLAYLPDFHRHDWSVREAYLELARREKYGLPLVDKEFIPVERIQLPTEEEIEELGVEVYL